MSAAVAFIMPRYRRHECLWLYLHSPARRTMRAILAMMQTLDRANVPGLAKLHHSVSSNRWVDGVCFTHLSGQCWRLSLSIGCAGRAAAGDACFLVAGVTLAISGRQSRRHAGCHPRRRQHRWPIDWYVRAGL